MLRLELLYGTGLGCVDLADPGRRCLSSKNCYALFINIRFRESPSRFFCISLAITLFSKRGLAPKNEMTSLKLKNLITRNFFNIFKRPSGV